MKRITIIFPGIGYHCDKPLLYYSRGIARQCGYEECVNLAYSYDGGNIRGNEQKMQEAFDVLYAQAEKRLKQIAFEQYDDILFISKSIGTAIASAYAKRQGISCRNVLYTPLSQTFGFEPQNGIAFIGTRDPWSDVGEIISLSERGGIPIYCYDKANHSLETDDIINNLYILGDVMKKTKDFCL